MDEFADYLLKLATTAAHGSPILSLLFFVTLAGTGYGVCKAVQMFLVWAFNGLRSWFRSGTSAGKLHTVEESFKASQATIAKLSGELDHMREVLDEVRAANLRAQTAYLELRSKHAEALVELAMWRGKAGMTVDRGLTTVYPADPPHASG